MIKVWILWVYMSTPYYGGGPMVVDNIATQEECLRLQKVFRENSYVNRSRCLEVVKIKGSKE